MSNEICTSSIAILMATYNGQEYISDQIDSILKQTFKDWELYIHDDGSNDNTVKIINSYSKKYPKKIHVIFAPPTGSAKNNFFYLMSCVEADYYMFCDQDDYWLNTKIENTYNKIREFGIYGSNEPLLVFTDLKVVDKNLNIISNKMSKYQTLKMKNTDIYHLLIQNVITGCTVMINKTCRNKALNCLDVNLVIMHDWWCALIASYFGRIIYLEDSLILYRQHGDNSVGAKNIHDIHYLTDKMHNGEIQKKSLKASRNQAYCFEQTFNLKDEVIHKYARLTCYSKINKIMFLSKSHIWKSGLIRNLGLIYYI